VAAGSDSIERWVSGYVTTRSSTVMMMIAHP